MCSGVMPVQWHYRPLYTSHVVSYSLSHWLTVLNNHLMHMKELTAGKTNVVNLSLLINPMQLIVLLKEQYKSNTGAATHLIQLNAAIPNKENVSFFTCNF